jgi:hypothetical protein
MLLTSLSPRRAVRTSRLLLTIGDAEYAIRKIGCDPLVASKAFRLLKGDGTLYDVIQTPYGPECDCPDFIFRRDGLDPDGCKHVQALMNFGMIDGHGAAGE